MHGITFGGHPQPAIALKNIEIMKREGIVEHVAETQGDLRSGLETLLDLPIVGDVRGTGFFYALELVKNKETRETFGPEESEWLLRDYLSGKLFERGLICRADDRGDPVVQVSPPLIAGQADSTRSSASSETCSPARGTSTTGGARRATAGRPRRARRRGR